jgi:hypothetical protein
MALMLVESKGHGKVVKMGFRMVEEMVEEMAELKGSYSVVMMG